MQQEKMVSLLSHKKDYLFDNSECDQEIIEALIRVEDDCYEDLMKIPLRTPSLVQVLAIAPGALDRLLLGEIGKMMLKNFTLGGLGIWWVKDILSAKSRCRAYNRNTFLNAINDPTLAKKMISTEEQARLAGDFVKKVAPDIINGVKDVRNTFYVN